jgi:hypothetical protein
MIPAPARSSICASRTYNQLSTRFYSTHWAAASTRRTAGPHVTSLQAWEHLIDMAKFIGSCSWLCTLSNTLSPASLRRLRFQPLRISSPPPVAVSQPFAGPFAAAGSSSQPSDEEEEEPEEEEQGAMVEDAALPLVPASIGQLDPVLDLIALDAAQPPSLMELADSAMMNDAVST